MYRDFACRKGKGLLLAGYAKNMPGGSVEVVAQGPRAALERFIVKLRKGSLLSRVDDVAVQWQEPSARYEGFTILY